MEKLFPTQQRTAEVILRKIEEASSPKVLFLEGLSGMGKDYVNSSIKDRLKSIGGIFLPEYTFNWNFDPDEVRSKLEGTSGAVVAVTPYEHNEARKKMTEGLPDIGLEEVVLRGLGLDEARALVASRIDDLGNRRELIASHSLGIPLLAESLMIDKNISPEEITTASALYLTRAYWVQKEHELTRDETIARHLSFEPPAEVYGLLKDWAQRLTPETYKDVDLVLSRMAKNKVELESPFLVASQSREMYSETPEGDGRCEVDFYVPHLTADQKEEIMVELGSRDGFHGGRRNRLGAFGVTYRKTNLGTNGRLVHTTEYERTATELMQELQANHETGKYPIRAEGEQSLFLMAAAHSGMPGNPFRWGWLMESMLQQKGLPYAVKNYLTSQEYYFDPKSSEIQFAEFSESSL